MRYPGGRGVCVLALMAGCLGSHAAAGQDTGTMPAVDRAGGVTADSLGHADWSWALRTPEGEDLTLDRFRGRPVFLNVWATWCAPCVSELASIERLARSLDGTGVAFVLVSPEDPARVRAFARAHGYRLPFLVEARRMPAAFGLVAVPTTWIIAPDGRIVLRHRGAAEWDQEPVRELLAALGTME